MNLRYWIGLAVLLLIAAGLSQPPPADRFTATFSIAAYDPATGDLGVAVASKFPAVGAMVPFAQAGVGAVATQALANLEYGPKGLQMMERGLSASEAMARLTENDPQRDDRQLGLVDAKGRSAAWTGKSCFNYAGHVTGENFSAQGNILAGPEVVQAIAKSFQSSKGSLAERLMAALEAGDAAGGDRRGKESAAMLVVRAGAGYGGVTDRWIDLRVDDHPEPVRELRRLLGVHTLYFGETKELVPLTPELVKEIQEVLKRTGFYKGEVSGVYDAATRKALEDFQGWENLEMRFRKDDQIDRVVLDYIRQHFGKKK
ncbi:MAG: DUF1028 domain-containing protein [Acidobacteria bacterium]|nr:DUF1028 domain-containing protein [Acidobacteriota bacterium]